MTDKIENFIDSIKRMDSQVLPVEKESILKHLKNVPDDISSDYCNNITLYVEDLLVLRNIVESVTNQPNLCHHVVDGLNEIQLGKLNRIALELASDDPCRNIDQVIEDTFGFLPATESTTSRAKIIITRLKSIGNYKDEAEKRLNVAKDMRLLCYILMLLHLGKDFERLALEKLSQITENELDRLIEMGLQ